MSDSDKKITRILATAKKHGIVFIAGFVAAVLCFVGLNALMETVSSSEYCGSKCHEMNSAYQSWELSSHGANNSGVRVECIDCHLPSKDKYFTHVVVKAYEGGKDLYKHQFGEDYDLEKVRKKVLDQIPSERCLNCHDSLLAKPVNSAARMAHMASLNRPEEPESRCVVCHEEAGHQRQNELFSP